MDENINIPNFEDMSLEEQENKLKSIVDMINSLNKENILHNNFYVIDISFNRLSNGKIIYDVTYNDPSSENKSNHLFYTEDTSNNIHPAILDEKQIQNLALLGNFDTSMIDKEQAEIKNLPNTDKGISLSSIKEREEFEKTADMLDLSPDEIEAIVKIDENSQIPNYEELFKGTISSQDIDGNQKLTTNYSMNDIMGLKYSSYKIVKNLHGTSFMVEINDDGSFEVIDNSQIEIIDNAPMSLMRSDGVLKEVETSVAFKLRDASSSINRDQSFGIYNDNGRYGAFYARGANSKERMLGEEIPCESYTRSTANEKEILDTRKNTDIDEAISAQERTDDGRPDKTENITPSDTAIGRKELIKKYANVYGVNVNKEDVEENMNNILEESHDPITDEEAAILAAEKALEDDEAEKSDSDKSASEKSKSEDDDFEIDHGTPWGNPNSIK